MKRKLEPFHMVAMKMPLTLYDKLLADAKSNLRPTGKQAMWIIANYYQNNPPKKKSTK